MYWGLELQCIFAEGTQFTARQLFCQCLVTLCGLAKHLQWVVTPETLTPLCLLQVLERWCTSPRTIEVLMNTYSIMQLPEEAMALVPLETLQVRFLTTGICGQEFRDPEHTLTQPGPKGLPPPTGKLCQFPYPAPEKLPRDPLMFQKKTHRMNTPKHHF